MTSFQSANTEPMASVEEIQTTHQSGMYAKAEHDACGVGFVVHIKGHKSHKIVQQGLEILKNIDHRGAVGADPLMGDGAGDRKSTRLNSSHVRISYAVFCLKKKKEQ